jgi:hypothetical protein
MTLLNYVAAVVVAVLAFSGGFYLGVVHGAPAWLDWAAEERRKRRGETGDQP